MLRFDVVSNQDVTSNKQEKVLRNRVCVFRSGSSVKSLTHRRFDMKLDSPCLIFVQNNGHLLTQRVYYNDETMLDAPVPLGVNYASVAPCIFSDQIVAASKSGHVLVLDYIHEDVDEEYENEKTHVKIDVQKVHDLSCDIHAGHNIRELTWNCDETLLISSDDGGNFVIWRYESEDRKMSSDISETAKQGLIRQAVRHFNADPKSALAALEHEYRLVGSDAMSKAQFMLETPGLSKRKIGEILGKPGEIYAALLDAFTGLMNFEDLSFEQAFREFLSKFRLPGEAQQIDRVLQSFSKWYHVANPFTLRSSEEALVLAFSSIVLNTDVNHPSVRAKMSRDTFVRTVRGVADGKGIPEKLLFDMYASIRAKPLVCTENYAESSSETACADGAMLEFVECPICQKPVSHMNMMEHMEKYHSHHSAPIIPSRRRRSSYTT